MYPESDRIEDLLVKYVHEELSEEERLELQQYLQRYPRLRQLHTELSKDPFLSEDMKVFNRIRLPRKEQASGSYKTTFPQRLSRRIPVMRSLAACIIAVLTISFAGYLIFRPGDPGNYGDIASRYKNNIPAGTNRAILTMEDGRSVLLEGDSTKLLADRENVRIEKLPDGTIVYETMHGNGINSQKTGKYHTITTPQGGQFRVVLPDSSIALLNAASSLRFPTTFGKHKRVVEINGEAYFNVKHLDGLPFQVTLPNGAYIEVLGTSFNVKAYQDEPVIKTTLTEGSIKMTSGSREILMKPGQQALLPIREPEAIQLHNEIDLLAETSWKDGYFQFEDMQLEDIMRQVARWYDVEVIYKDRVTKRFNVLRLSRSVPLPRLLELLEMTGHVKFLIEGRKVTVMR